ncbi:MAG: family 43 glycosylhydrolase [Cytophagaceae bacterium]|jgi:beta-xylosidase|nr:family 43 glycosylhydrolase [Cytophagaceae bacterium]
MNNNSIILFFLLLSQISFSQESTYRNPIIAGDFPDPTVIRVGDTYYAAGTSAEWAPPYRLYESKDLVNWTFLGGLFNNVPEWTHGSFWAPELFYRNGTFYVYYTARRKRDRKSFIGVATTDDIRKGFTDHGVIVEWTNEAIDAFAIEIDGKPYLTWKAYGLDNDRNIEILGAELTSDGLALAGEAFTLVEAETNTWEAGGIEGQCIVKHGDYLYMFYAGNNCCGVNCNYMTGVARAKSIKGPWEKYKGNPILTGDEHWRCTGHGTLVATPNNRYFYLYHAYRGTTGIYTGRQGMMDEIVWDDATGWLHFRYGTTASLQAETPVKGTQQSSVGNFEDNFDSDQLNHEWMWDATLPKPEYSFSDSKLALKGKDTPVGSFLGLRPRRSDYLMIATLDVVGAPAGICLYGTRNNAIGLSVRNSSLELWQISDGTRKLLLTKPFKLATVTIFLEVTFAQYCRFGYVNEEGASAYIGDPIHVQGLPQWDRSAMPGINIKGLNIGRFNSVKLEYDFRMPKIGM